MPIRRPPPGPARYAATNLPKDKLGLLQALRFNWHADQTQGRLKRVEQRQAHRPNANESQIANTHSSVSPINSSVFGLTSVVIGLV